MEEDLLEGEAPIAGWFDFFFGEGVGGGDVGGGVAVGPEGFAVGEVLFLAVDA